MFSGIRYYSGSLPGNEQTYVQVAVVSFNSVAILSLFIVFYQAETSTNAQFGKAIRDNISTIIVALIISFIGSVISLVKLFLS